MPDTKDTKSGCEVCTQLIKEKHRWNFLWKIACFIFAALAVVFAILYFGSGAVTTTTEIKVDNVGNDNEIADNSGTVIIGNGGEAITGTLEQTDYTPIICITILSAAVILVVGGIIIAHHHKKNH